MTTSPFFNRVTAQVPASHGRVCEYVREYNSKNTIRLVPRSHVRVSTISSNEWQAPLTSRGEGWGPCFTHNYEGKTAWIFHEPNHFPGRKRVHKRDICTTSFTVTTAPTFGGGGGRRPNYLKLDSVHFSSIQGVSLNPYSRMRLRRYPRFEDTLVQVWIEYRWSKFRLGPFPRQQKRANEAQPRLWAVLARFGCGLGSGLGSGLELGPGSGVGLGLRPYLDRNRNQNTSTVYQPKDPFSQIVMGPTVMSREPFTVVQAHPPTHPPTLRGQATWD